MHQLAVIIPYYKINFLEQTLSSLDGQTNKQFNVYIGDDASPDDPQEIINNYKNKLNLTYQKFENNLGGQSLERQWDRCIALTKGEPWLMVLGDDDILGTNCVEEFYAHLSRIEDAKINVTKFATIEIDGNNKEISGKFTHPRIEKSTTSYVKKLKGETRSSLIEYIFRKTAYQKHGFKEFPLAFGSDNLAWIEFSDCGNIYTINEAVVYFRLSEASISGNAKFAKQQKLKAMYLTKRYLLINYAGKFSKEELGIIVESAVPQLKSAFRRDYLERLNFLWLSIKLVGLKKVLKYF